MPQTPHERQASVNTSSARSARSNRSETTPAVVIVRHGETEWSRTGRHTGRTDVELTRIGEDQARIAGRLIRAVLRGPTPPLVISSPRIRARRTAELAGFLPERITEDAAEWDYGTLEGLTSTEIAQTYPGWTIWSGPIPGGETAAAISIRIDRLLEQARASSRPAIIFSHGHASRCIAARWLDEPVTHGRHFRLDTGAVSALGYEHGRPAMLRWNLDESVVEGPESPTAEIRSTP